MSVFASKNIMVSHGDDIVNNYIVMFDNRLAQMLSEVVSAS